MAYSPRLRPWLKRQLVVNIIDATPRRLTFTSSEYAEACIRKVFAEHAEYPELKSLGDADIERELVDIHQVLELVKAREAKLCKKIIAQLHSPEADPRQHVREGRMTPHAECSLLETLHQDTQGQTFTYIAVTKLSCLSCWLLFEAYRKYSKRKFFIRGCHSDPSHPWVLPDFGDKELHSLCRSYIMRNSIFKLLAKRIEKSTRLRKESQSSVGSDGPDGVRKMVIGRDQLAEAALARMMSRMPVAGMSDLPAGEEGDGDGDRGEDSDVCLDVF